MPAAVAYDGVQHASAAGSIESGAAELPLVAYSDTTDNCSPYFATTSQSGETTSIVINLGTRYDNSSSADNFAASTRGTGAALSLDDGVEVGGSGMIYRALDGATITFGDPNGSGSSNICGSDSTGSCASLALGISGKTGMTTDFDWTVHQNCPLQNPDDTAACGSSWRLAGVSSSAGYAINWAYASNAVPRGQNAGGDWYRRTTAEFSSENLMGSTEAPLVYFNYFYLKRSYIN